MAKIDRLGWAAGIAFEVFGVRIGIRVNDPMVLESVLSRVPAGWTRLDEVVVDRLYSVVTPLVRRGNVRHLCVLYGDHMRCFGSGAIPRGPSALALAILLPSLLRQPWKIKAATRGRWRNAIQATIDCNGAFNALPRWFYQVKDAASRAAHFFSCKSGRARRNRPFQADAEISGISTSFLRR